ncbi:DUF397 domain-containing protein [Streptomyces sp. NPDC001544]|uniref:DUF397 domain-containing protein n=1 Tax=Streptomyces sp. NPDC001544 TaxID=3364584 RepID=UPI00367ECE66
MSDFEVDLYASDLTRAIWRKASSSGAENNCEEVAELPGGARAVRDSKDPGRAPLRLTASEWVAFRDGLGRYGQGLCTRDVARVQRSAEEASERRGSRQRAGRHGFAVEVRDTSAGRSLPCPPG